MKKCILITTVLAGSLLSGCATGPKTPVNSTSLDGQRVIYIEQADRVPKDVLLAAHTHAINTQGAALAALPPEVLAELLAELAKLAPTIVGQYSQERMYNALLGRRLLFKGYGGDELVEIRKIIESTGGVFEYLTPQNLRK